MAGIVRFNPFRDIVTLRNRIDRLFEDSHSRARGGEEEFGAAAHSAGKKHLLRNF